jgi:hypothetical protein
VLKYVFKLSFQLHTSFNSDLIVLHTPAKIHSTMADGRKTPASESGQRKQPHACSSSGCRSNRALTMRTVNDARAVRIAEVIQDFRNLHIHLSQMNVTAPSHEHHLVGYEILRACVAEGQAVLVQPFASTNTAASTPESQRRQLQALVTTTLVCSTV